MKNLHLVLQKGHNFHIIGTILWGHLLLLKLRFHKWLRGIKKPIVHYYAVCWNEEKMLPFMFRYYDSFVDHFTIYDNYSDDGSEEIIRSHKNTDVVKYSMEEGIDDKVYQRIKNNCWKKSRGKADYVIVCDIDEFLYHPDLPNVLQDCVRQRVSLPITEGYNMYSAIFPSVDESLIQQVRKGVPDSHYSKSIIFDPHRIVEINYEAGAHKASPVGVVRRGAEPFKVLHYKNLGLDYVLDRFHVLGKRLSERNKESGLGTHYLSSDESIISEFNDNLSHCQTVI